MEAAEVRLSNSARPVFLGGGKQLISGLSKRAKLKLESAKGFSSGSVVLRYMPAK